MEHFYAAFDLNYNPGIYNKDPLSKFLRSKRKKTLICLKCIVRIQGMIRAQFLSGRGCCLLALAPSII